VTDVVQLAAASAELLGRLDERFKLVHTRLDHQDENLTEIKALAKLTNGRVTELEAERREREARKEALAEREAEDEHDAEVEENRQHLSLERHVTIRAAAWMSFASLGGVFVSWFAHALGLW
jgi:hypothetical protein